LKLLALERPAAGEPEGVMVLLHGRGADETQLAGMLDALDPGRRLLGLAPRAPREYDPGACWYAVERSGVPEPRSFLSSCEIASGWLDSLGVAPEQIVLGGFSQGATMSYALGLGRGRKRPAALIALAGYLPGVPGWELDIRPPLPPVAIGHGRYDEVIPVELARSARAKLEGAGAKLLYREWPLGHAIDPAFAAEAAGWLRAALSRAEA
jgi:phospholipase/carboxylesterase